MNIINGGFSEFQGNSFSKGKSKPKPKPKFKEDEIEEQIKINKWLLFLL